jgi:hypothetical protein
LSEALEYQVGIYIDTSVHPKAADDPKEVARIQRRAMRQFLEDGTEINGVRIVGRWRNSVKRGWRKTTDAGQSLEDFHQTLHGARGAFRALARKYGA